MEREEGLQTLIDVFRKKETNLLASASKLENITNIEDGTTLLDTIIQSLKRLFQNEDDISKTLQGVFKSSTFKANQKDDLLPLNEAYALIKTNFQHLLQYLSRDFASFELERMQIRIKACFHLSQVEDFVFRSGSSDHFDGSKLNIEAKRLKEVKNARRQYFTFQVLEQPANKRNKRRLRDVVLSYKRDIESFKKIVENKRKHEEDDQKILMLEQRERKKDQMIKDLGKKISEQCESETKVNASVISDTKTGLTAIQQILQLLPGMYEEHFLATLVALHFTPVSR